jgi:hypothetical protein
MKNYLILFCLLFSSVAFSQSKLYLQHKTTGKLIQFKLNSKIHYTLHSDSTLGFDKDQVERDNIQWAGEESFFLKSGEEISFTDVKMIRRYGKLQSAMRNIGVPLICVGSPFLLQGLTKFQLEGMERNNADYVPMAIAGGGFFAVIGALPYLVKPNKFDMTSGDWELVGLQ